MMLDAVTAEVVVMAFEPVALTRKYHVADEVMPETRMVIVVVPEVSTAVASVQPVRPSFDFSTT